MDCCWGIVTGLILPNLAAPQHFAQRELLKFFLKV